MPPSNDHIQASGQAGPDHPPPDLGIFLPTLKSAGQSILIVDKNTMVLVRLADHHVILAKGQVVWQGDIPALWASKDLTARFLGA